MSFHNRLLLNRAAITDLRTLEVMFLVDAHDIAGASTHIERAGGRIRRTEPAVGYIRADVPTERLVEIVDTRTIHAYQIASLSRGSWYRDGPPRANAEMYRDFERVIPSVRQPPHQGTALPMLSADQARGSGYTADDDAGVGKWLQEHPAYDGRGVTIAILEPSQIEFSHPMLAAAKSLDGRPVSKLAGILNTLDDDVLDDTRVRLETEVHATRAWHRVGDRTYAVPRPGTFRFGIFTIPVAINLIHQFAVLEDSASNEIWVDTDGDSDFRDESPVPDVNDRFEARFLELAYPAPHTLSFVVAHGREPNIVHVYVARGSHHTMTTSVAAGSRTTDGLAYGVAPGARVLLVRTHTADYRLRDAVEGFLEAAQRPDVDILSDSSGLVMIPDTSTEFIGMLLQRIVAVYQKPIFHSAGNMQLFLNNISPLGDVFSVGGSIGPKTHAALFGGAPIDRVMVHPIGAAGPTLDGALKPDFLAPMQRLAADLFRERTPLLAPAYSPTSQLPAGYQISCCTSASAPYAAGIGALLLSAAKQAGVRYSVDTFGRALRIGAQFLSGYPSHEQGNGVLDLEGAWSEMNRAVSVPRIRAIAPVVHPLAAYAARGSDGQGLYERDGWSAGMTGTRMMRFVRESGTKSATKYRLSWTGNDATFTSEASLELPLGSNVSLPVRIAPRTPGVHSAILNLHDPDTEAIVFRTQVAVVATERLGPKAPLQFAGSLSVLRSRSHYVSLHASGNALEITLEVLRGSLQVAVIPTHSLYPNYYGHVYPLAGRIFTPGRYHLVWPHPRAGTWTISLSNLGSHRAGPPDAISGITADYRVGMRLLTATLQTRAAGHGQLNIAVENAGSQLKEPVLDTSMGALRTHTGEVATTGLPTLYEIFVPEDASTLALHLRSAQTHSGTFELHLYDCTSGECFSYDFTLPAAPEHTMVMRKPAPGRWVAAVNAAPAPAMPGRFVLDTLIAGPPLGHGEPLIRVPGSESKWTASITVPQPSAAERDVVPVVFCELRDAAMNREEEQHPWETRVNELLWNLADRRPAVGSATYRLK